MRLGLRSRRGVAISAALALGATVLAAAVAPSATAADPCGPGSNPIVCENSKPGADPEEWDVYGAGSPELQGFSTDISVDAGDEIGFKIDTTSTDYTIDIYRTGWYGGKGARKIDSVEPSAPLPQHQPECVSDVTTELYDCGNWDLSATWDVPSDAVSGVYVALLRDRAHDWWSHIVFIVRNDTSRSDVIFQTSDPTWQAYNTYGGSDFYQGAANGRAYKISYNRPVVTRADWEGRDFYFSAEYPLVRFLERNGYDVSYQAGVDTDRYGELLTNHKVFLSVGHDEYWSGAQRANVEAARDAGVNLAFFSGNEVYWHTRYEPSVAGEPTDYRTLVSYKETWSEDKIDPSDEWTGTWRDPRFASPDNGAAQPENGLTGTLYMSNNSDLPVTVSAEEGKLRLWRDTSLASLAPGTSQELAPHTVGYESDEDLDNGFRPAGLIRLSTTNGWVPQYLQDFGQVVQEGTTTHHVTLYRAPSGALVFGAGTIQWTWGLDQTHDGDGAPADPRMQQATLNLLADMHALPTTLQEGLVQPSPSTDTVGPTVAITAPASGGAVANGTAITLQGTAADVGGRVAGVEVSTDAGASWHPADGTTSWTYSFVQSGLGAAEVRVRAVDDSANIGDAATWSSTVSCPCSVYGETVPDVPAANDASPVELGLRFTPERDGYITGVRFYKGGGNTGTHTGTLWSAAGERLAQVTFVDETETGWQEAQFASAVPVTAGVQYVVSYTAPNGRYAAQSKAFWYAGRSAPPLSVAGGWGSTDSGTYGPPGEFPQKTWDASQYYVDVLFSESDTTPLTVGGFSPAPGSGSVAPGATISAVLSKPVGDGSPALTVSTAEGSPVEGSSSYDAASRTVSFTAAAALAPATTFTATVTATDLSGTASWSFRTAAAPQTPGARTVSLYDETDVPEVLEAADGAAVTLGVRFSSTADGVVEGVRFYKGPNNGGTHVGALWALDGTTPLAQAVFTDETTSGWQTVRFAEPVRIVAGQQYVASYRTTVGRYSVTIGGFSGVPVTRDPLVTWSDSGAYSYADAYPGNRISSSYAVDVIFTRDVSVPTVVSRTPGDGALGADAGAPVSVTFSAPVASGAVLALRSVQDDTVVTGQSELSADRKTLTFTPDAPLQSQTAYAATASSLESDEGVAIDDVSWSFETASGNGCPCTLFGSAVPAAAAADDGAAVELGVAFRPAVSGQITGVRFYKGPGNTGTHVGTVWSASGQSLRTVTFTEETDTGWQTATFAAPLDVTAGTTYVVSYLAPNGHYAATGSAFTADVVAGPLTAPAVGNGRYKYGGGFPTGTWQQTNYFVDVVFVPAEVVLPVVTATSPVAGASGVSVLSSVTAHVSVDSSSGTPTVTLAGPAGPVAGSSSYDPSTRTVTFVPAAPLPHGATITAAVDVGGTELEGGRWTFTTSDEASMVTTTLWTDEDVPAVVASTDSADVQVGIRLTSSVPGLVTAVRFYKGAANTGAHTVKVWNSDGRLLGQARSTAETTSGWQTVELPAPVAVAAGQTYTVAYQSDDGRYAYTAGGLEDVRTVGPLSTLTPGGAYVYGNGTSFPGGSSSAWYGVDVVFAHD